MIGGQDVVLGLGFLGFEGYAVGTEAEVQQVLGSVLADPDVALVLLSEDWAAVLPELFAAAAGTEEGPLIVEIPASLEPGDGTSLHKRVELALGISLEE